MTQIERLWNNAQERRVVHVTLRDDSRVKTFGQYVLSCLVLIALLGAIAFAFAGPAGRQVVVVSAALALAVQTVAFTVARILQRQNLMLGWGLGSVLRLVALVLYALVVAKLWRAPITPALLSFAAFLFVTTVVEPVFLKR